ncbi:MAG TPA: hypothetical protein VD997_10710 [Phycisphaerales bacterium]|nr:hypothetical protein [Phycisphaerales bacterium]
MGRTPVRRSSSNRYLRQRRPIGGPKALTSSAGLTDRPTVDQLERRQMLFSLAITPDIVDPNTGLGTVRQHFSYVIPYLHTNVEIQPPQPPEVTTENFSEAGFGPIGSGQFFQSGLRVRHNIFPPGDILINAQPPNADNQVRWLQVTEDTIGEFMTLEFFTPAQDNAPARPVVVTSATVTFEGLSAADLTGLLTDNVRVDLTRGANQAVVASFTGAALRNQFQTGNPALGTGAAQFNLEEGFDAIRITMIEAPTGGTPGFRIRDVSWSVPQARFAELIESRIFSAVVVLTGPVGATATFLDLYGRDMVASLAAGQPEGGQGRPIIDANDDGVPDFNDGIGSIHLLNTDSRTAISIWGGTAAPFTDDAPDDSDFNEFNPDFRGNWAFTLTDELIGNFDAFEDAGFAYAWDIPPGETEIDFAGLPPGPGSVIIGSPWVRPNGNPAQYNPGGLAPGQGNTITDGFTQPDQGIFIDDGGNLGSVYLHGILHGSSQFQGFVDRIYVGYLVGSITVQGDLGALYAGTDAGQWVPDPDFNPTNDIDPVNKTAGQLLVGRTMGELAIAGRSLLDVQVVGDLNNAAVRPARDNFTHYEREWVNAINTSFGTRDVINTILNNTNWVARSPNDRYDATSDQAMVFGPELFRNDQLLGAEWIGGMTTGVRIKGALSGQDPTQGEDTNDVYAFAVDGSQDISIEGIAFLNGTEQAIYMRIMDENGRTYAAPQEGIPGRSSRITFKPRSPGVYYLVVSDPTDRQTADTQIANVRYTISITGLAAATLGAYRTGGGSGFTDVAAGEGNVVQVLAGNIGSLRIGTGFVNSGGALVDPLSIINTDQDDDDNMAWQGGSISAPGNVYNITAGSDIGHPNNTAGSPINMIVGGDVGTIITGMYFGFAGDEGDVNYFNLQAGGRIAAIRVSGSIGVDHDRSEDPARYDPVTDSFTSITTGANGGNGDIGHFEVGGNIFASGLRVRTSDGSTITTFLVNSNNDAVDEAPNRVGIFLGTVLAGGLRLETGLGSNIRFADVQRIDLISSRDVFQPIIGGQTIEITDDAGSRLRITVDNAPEGTQIGTIRRIPVDGSQGVAIGRISVDLTGGGVLQIDSISSGVGAPISIGFIEITGADNGAGIQISGQTRIEVYRIESTAALDFIANSTGGDMIAIDVAGLNRLDLRGHLGRTTVGSWGPSLLGPYLGLATGNVNAVGGALGVGPAEAFYENWSGAIYHPINVDVFDDDNSALDDIGSPLDGYLNGLVVRTGNLEEAVIHGTVGDVILQDAAGELTSLNANADRITPVGRFEGIVGHVFAATIVDINIGDGLAQSERGPMLTSGIFATNDIRNVFTSRTSGAVISGVINAFNETDEGATEEENIDGLGNLTLTNGLVRDASIGSELFDGFWASFYYDDVDAPTGNIGTIRLTNTPLFRSRVSAEDLSNLTISGANGYFDASRLIATGIVDRITVTGFRNSTLTGTITEIARNEILAARDVNTITAVQDMSDLVIDIAGRVTQGITAVNITRSQIDVDAELKNLAATNDVRGSAINVGNLPSMTVGRNLQSSSVFVSGLLGTLSAGNRIANTDIRVTGPGGTIGTISAPNLISGEIRASGTINAITVSRGDLIADIVTINGGNVNTLTAGRDLVITGDIAGSVGTLTAGRHIGSPATAGVLLIRNNLSGLNAGNGQLYGSIHVGESITGPVVIGGAANKLGNNQVGKGSLVASGPINSVTINGDFDGDIISFTSLGTITINNGSLLPGNTVAAFNGSIANFTINNGNLYGNVHADVDITRLAVLAGGDGVFGDIGINPASSGIVSYDARRNQLPVGVSVNGTGQGPTISAGRNIVAVEVPGGSVFETYFIAGQSIINVTVSGTVQNDPNTVGIQSAFVAGDSIETINVGGVNNTAFVAGVSSLGADRRLGGVGDNADVTKPGSIKTVRVGNGIVDALFAAGIDPGLNGIYLDGDDRSVQGLSTINTLNISGPVINTRVFADILPGNIANDNRFVRGGTTLPSTNAQIDNGVGTPGTAFTGTRTFNNVNGANVTFAVSGPGQAFFNTATNTLILRNTTSATNLTVSSSTGVTTSVDVVTNDDASLGSVTFQGRVAGDSDLIVDGNVGSLTYGDFEGTGTISIGGDVNTITFNNFRGGFLDAENVQTFRVNGQFGDPNTAIFNEARVQLLNVNTISIGGNASAVISVDRDAQSLVVSGNVDRAAFRFGRSLGSFQSGNFNRSFLSAGDNIGNITITGDANQSNIAAGADFGTDAAPGGTGTAADRVSSGNIGAISIAGNFAQSSISAGYLRGRDGFIGTTDDLVGGGRSHIASVTIGGVQVGSSRGSETYRIASNGTIGPVRIGGANFTGSIGNFALEAPRLQPQSLVVTDLFVTVTSGISTANIVFNQPIDGTSISGALSVAEVRGSGDVVVRLVEGIDYTVTYDNNTNTARVTFSNAVTARNLPAVPGRPGPGVYRFEIDQSRIRARLTGVTLDGNGDGLSQIGEDFSGDSIVGDAGDRLTPAILDVGGRRIDLYGPTNLDFVLDDNFTPDGLPDPNNTYTVRGFIGDHPDNDANVFRFGGDLDVYAVTLQAGQILRLGSLQGTAQLAQFGLLDANGNFAALSGAALPIFTDFTDQTRLTFDADFLIKQTGTYFIFVGNPANITDPTTVTNPPPAPGGVGDYNFTVTIFDDGDSGFNAPTDAGNGQVVVNAPGFSQFAGNDGVLGTGDDIPSITISGYVFTYSRGADNVAGNGDDLISGVSPDGEIVSSRTGPGQVITVIDSAIGPKGHAGIPDDYAADVDIYKLNNGQPIAPGTLITITVKLTDLGADLGSTSATSPVETRGQVQFGVFDISSATGIDDGSLIFSPTDFTPNGGKPNTILADNGRVRYGYDANSDFFITFPAPDRIDQPGAAARLAVYIQGVRNTDYQIQIVTGARIEDTTRPTQNFLLETAGGIINWLEAGGQATSLLPFFASSLAFTGTINGQSVQDYIITSVVATLNSLFQSSGGGNGFDVNFSANPADFEFQPFSTVFITSSADPISPIFTTNLPLDPTPVSQPYGYSEHSDALNADLEDEAVVFAPSFALQGLSPSRADVDEFVQALSAAVARRAGELMGLRVTEAYDANTNTFDPFAANAVDERPGNGRAYTLPNFNRFLSDPFDSVNRTDFYLGQQNARSLLDKVLNQL